MKVFGVGVGDYVCWVGESEQLTGLLSRMMGRVVRVSRNQIAKEVKSAYGIDAGGPWIMVRFENGMQRVVRNAALIEKISVH